MTTPTSGPHPARRRRPPVVAAALDLLGTARHDLAEAMTTTVADRALRRGPPGRAAHRGRRARGAHPAGGATKRPRNVWAVLPQVAPELAEWAAFFAAGAGKRAAAEAGLTRAVSAARGRRPAARRADLPRAGRDDARRWPTSRSCRGRRLDRSRTAALTAAVRHASDPFVHLHVASGYSLRYGASHPHVAGRAGRRARHGHPRADRPRRPLRRGASSSRPAQRPASARCSASTWRSSRPGCSRLPGWADPSRRARAGAGRAPRPAAVPRVDPRPPPGHPAGPTDQAAAGRALCRLVVGHPPARRARARR